MFFVQGAGLLAQRCNQPGCRTSREVCILYFVCMDYLMVYRYALWYNNRLCTQAYIKGIIYAYKFYVLSSCQSSLLIVIRVEIPRDLLENIRRCTVYCTLIMRNDGI